MCSIYGSANQSMLEILHSATIFRGEYAFSLLSISNKNSLKIIRQKDHPEEINLSKNTKFALGHNQAPTSAQREYLALTSHPFRSGDWIVGHNGVITNSKELTEKYCKWNKSPVDSAVIPSLLNQFSTDNQTVTEIENISSVLSLLEGTFAVWIFNEQSNSLYIARQGSTLFCNTKTGDFCSINSISGNWTELIEGNIYQINLNTKNVKAIGKFANTTPYFTI